MSRSLTAYFVAVIALLAAIIPSRAQTPRMTVRATADSTTLIMGDRTTVNVEVVKNAHEGVLLNIPEVGASCNGLEMAALHTDSTDLGNGRIQLDYRFTFQAFDPAPVVILPAFSYASQGDTVTSDVLTFKVLPVEIPPVLGNVEQVDSLIINPDAPPVTIEARAFDWVAPWMWIALLAAIALIAAIILVRLYRKNGPRLFIARKPEPPYEKAMRRLNEMKATGMIEKSSPKQFFSEVTDIFRAYLEGRFNIQALEMTSRQIIDEIRRNPEIHLTAGQLEQLLQISDYVKFAAMDPTPDERMLTYKTIREFVESTKPVEENPKKTRAKQ